MDSRRCRIARGDTEAASETAFTFTKTGLCSAITLIVSQGAGARAFWFVHSDEPGFWPLPPETLFSGKLLD